ncbi:DUF1259 domain-containing protein [Azospirillum sp. TSO22-1]|uniref:DUF1259 domain-containing protein n=1 Tax=Azospirillum sp. TSO22-1 TaxID=716789 RepID=UPI000D6456D3|nr:DUF1259 domain-containing protein [Azospirillum sp. TSO22-1]
MRHVRVAAALVATVGLSGTALAADWKAVDEAMGRAGAMQPDDVYKYSIPRTDLKVTVDGVAVKPALALGSWVAFKGDDGHAMAMGDLEHFPLDGSKSGYVVDMVEFFYRGATKNRR